MSGPVLITGASGFAGSHLLELLAGRDELVAWTRSDPAPAFASLARWDQVDLLDRDRVRTAIRMLRPAAVYHCAGTPHVAESFTDTVKPLASNVLGTHHLLDALRRASVACRVLITGSATVYGSSNAPLTEDSVIAPASPYAVSKLAQEDLGRRALDEDGIDVIVTRSFNHTGPRQTPSFMAPSIARQIALIERGARPAVLRIGNTTPKRDFSDVRDVVRAYQALMRAGTPGEVYNVASGVGRSVRDMLDAFISAARVEVVTETDPARTRSNDPAMIVGDPTRLTRATGWHPEIPFERTISDLLEYWRSQV